MCDKSDRKIMVCPIYKELCVGGRCASFSQWDDPRTGELVKCRMWSHVRGKCPQCNQDMDWQDCSLYWSHVASLEGSQMTRHVVAQVSESTKAFVDALPEETQRKVLERASIGLVKTLLASNVDKLIAPATSSNVPQIEQPK